MERRRQIALKALSERLARTTDSSRQKILPKSFPHHHSGHGHSHGPNHGHGHSHGHGHQFSDSNQPPFIASKKAPMTFEIPAIPLPPPPSMVAVTSAQDDRPQSPETLINLDNSNEQTTNNS